MEFYSGSFRGSTIYTHTHTPTRTHAIHALDHTVTTFSKMIYTCRMQIMLIAMNHDISALERNL